MNHRIDDMITDGAILTNKPVQRKRKAGHWSVQVTQLRRFCKKSSPDGFRHQIVDFNRRIVDNVGYIIKKPGRSESVAVDSENNDQQGEGWEKMSFGYQRFSFD